VPLCPEVECGLPVPREPMRLEGDPAHPRLLTRTSKIDHTERMQAWTRQRVGDLAKEDLCGFIFKSRSPSCGYKGVKVHSFGRVIRKGQGLFAREFTASFPLLPVEDESRLQDQDRRENFIERLFACRRWHELFTHDRSRAGLVAFHADHKLLLMAHSPQLCRELGRLVAGAEGHGSSSLYSRYGELFSAAMRQRATPGKHANVLQHLLGYFKKQLADSERQELREVIEQYRRGLLPLLAPITLFRHLAATHGERYLARQWYLHPHPLELKLRNHA
jgi:uncharacterized protein YbgA (DUF1722 family)/uncharacterized protein YbbK (DUF523 family)